MQNTLAKFNQSWMQNAFPEGAMTDDQFVAYASECLFGEGVECLYDTISETQGEISRFGDSGPGSMLRLRETIDEFNKIADRYTAITGRKVTRPRLPVFPYYPQDDFEEAMF